MRSTITLLTATLIACGGGEEEEKDMTVPDYDDAYLIGDWSEETPFTRDYLNSGDETVEVEHSNSSFVIGDDFSGTFSLTRSTRVEDSSTGEWSDWQEKSLKGPSKPTPLGQTRVVST